MYWSGSTSLVRLYDQWVTVLFVQVQPLGQGVNPP